MAPEKSFIETLLQQVNDLRSTLGINRLAVLIKTPVKMKERWFIFKHR
jgi:hypothetical protein